MNQSLSKKKKKKLVEVNDLLGGQYAVNQSIGFKRCYAKIRFV